MTSEDQAKILSGHDSILTTYEGSDWQCELFGSGSNGIVFTPIKGHEPNRFWRWMQYLCFGNRWKKVKENV